MICWICVVIWHSSIEASGLHPPNRLIRLYITAHMYIKNFILRSSGRGQMLAIAGTHKLEGNMIRTVAVTRHAFHRALQIPTASSPTPAALV
jgi:hypothetical protein